MRTCPTCATEVEDSYLFCPEDGSSLAGLVDHSATEEPTVRRDQDNGSTSAVLLYCPTCAAEYPLTFTHCPVHYVRLTKNRITRREEPQPSPHVEAEVSPPATSDRVLDDPELFTEAPESVVERPAFRRAASAMLVCLALLGVVGLYAFISLLARRSAHVTQVATHAEAEPVPFIETPLAAQNYTEQQPSRIPQTTKDNGEKQPSHIPPGTQKNERGALSSAHHETSK